MAKSSNARDRILTTAGELFNARGYSCVGINEIIEKSETAKATFYHHFKTKEALCEAWLQEVHDRFEIRRQELLEAPGSAEEKIVGYFEKLHAYLKQTDFRGCPYSNTATVSAEHEASLRKQVEVHKLGIRDFFIELSRGLASSGSRAKEVGEELFLLYSGSTTEAQNLSALWPVEAAIRIAKEICQREKG